MSRKARTPIVEYNDYLAIELPGDKPATESDRLNDQELVVVYSRLPGRNRWQLRALRFDRPSWTRSAIRRWWAAHEVVFLGADELDRDVPEICRHYDAPSSTVPTIVLVHRNTPMLSARKQIEALKRGKVVAEKGKAVAEKGKAVVEAGKAAPGKGRAVVEKGKARREVKRGA